MTLFREKYDSFVRGLLTAIALHEINQAAFVRKNNMLSIVICFVCMILMALLFCFWQISFSPRK